ncbi:hypothetical protein NDU88_009518 [Pleurodeles waltl]|uniref:Uncharacterized protein n=1 Tax=Pleurodeles waltl TaxID=8319 RepID=A0AAV7RVG4_PLEWA|nr:hypothetical protein NDU88_009518 [Pleurodeles waltl]
MCGADESIAEAFTAYYEEVYTSVTQMTEADCAALLRDILLPKLSVKERIVLDAELTEEEVSEAFPRLQSGKAAGPNGLPMELFKCVGRKPVKYMLPMFRESGGGGGIAAGSADSNYRTDPEEG